MWPRNHRIDQLAALGKLMQSGMELAQIFLSEPPGTCFGYCLTRCGWCGFRYVRGLGSNDTMDRTIGRIDARNRRGGQRRIVALPRIILPIPEVASDQ
jgi:hypothetical protein